MERSVAILGSTGSVGTQALDVCAKEHITVDALTAGSDVVQLEKQIRRFRPRLVGVRDEKAAADLRLRTADLSLTVVAGEQAASEVAALCNADTVINSITGIAGLTPSVRTIEAGKHLALANKETMVAYGSRIMTMAKEKGTTVLPVDSEHSAIFQCLRGNDPRSVRRLLITASGGPFYRKNRSELSAVTPEMALAHPTWRMGPRITIDSATLMNKGFEVIEAAHLFSVEREKIEVIVHPESIIHSMVEYHDRAVMAQMSLPDMRLCVQYALSYPDRWDSDLLAPLDLTKLSCLHFEAPDIDRFPLLSLAFRTLERGGVVGAAMNAADEVAVSLFLQGRISFPRIAELVCRVTEDTEARPADNLDDLLAVDADARERTRILASV